MKTSLDCIPCFVRQALDAARQLSADMAFHERILRDVLRWTSAMDLNQSPPVLGQRIHRHLRELTGNDDPYRQAKQDQNRGGCGCCASVHHHHPLFIRFSMRSSTTEGSARVDVSPNAP